MNKKRFLNKNYLTQHTDKKLELISSFLSLNNYLYNNKVINIDNKNNQEALYSFYDNLLNIPDNFYRLDKNYLQFEKIVE